MHYKSLDQNRLKGLPGYIVSHVHCSPASSRQSVVNISFSRGCEFVTPTIIGPQLKKLKRSFMALFGS